MEAKMLLKDPDIYPSYKVLEETLGKDIYTVLESFLGTITGESYGLDLQWRFYNDGKAWLGKVTERKKTVLWLSIWEGHFKTSFFFTEKHREAIEALEISDNIKQDFAAAKPTGKLIPMIFEISDGSQHNDLLTVVRFKKSLK